MSVGRFLIVTALLAIALLAGAAVTHTAVIPWIIHRQEAILVPEFAGMTLAQAEAEARRVGLSVEVGDEVFQDSSPPGTVLGQMPGPLRSVRSGRRVRLVISKGEALARVPDLLGMSLRQSEITLLREKLELGRVSRSYDPWGGLGICAQRPHPGTQISRGSRVDLVRREDNERLHYRVPSLTGRSLVKVREELAVAGFELRRLTYRRDSEVFPGTILEQWPLAGSRIPQGGSLELVASTRN